MKIGCHITVNGTPWCEHLLSHRYSDITCGHLSLAAAHRARKSIQRRVQEWHQLKVVRGHCPS